MQSSSENDNSQDLRYTISKKISSHFRIPITSIFFCGSAHIGSSPHKGTKFDPKSSDLDVSIINTQLFIDYIRMSIDKSDGYIDITKFPKTKSSKPRESREQFILYAARGIFRPDLMPSCPERANWFNFFNTLSREFQQWFTSINAGLYLSEQLFLEKQKKTIEEIRNQGV